MASRFVDAGSVDDFISEKQQYYSNKYYSLCWKTKNFILKIVKYYKRTRSLRSLFPL